MSQVNQELELDFLKIVKSILIIWKIVIRLKNRVEKYCSQQCIKIIAVSSLKQNEIYKSNDSNKWNGKCIKIRYYSYTRPLPFIGGTHSNLKK